MSNERTSMNALIYDIEILKAIPSPNSYCEKGNYPLDPVAKTELRDFPASSGVSPEVHEAMEKLALGHFPESLDCFDIQASVEFFEPLCREFPGISA